MRHWLRSNAVFADPFDIVFVIIDETQKKSELPSIEAVELFLQSVKNARVDRFSAVGEGEDLRLQGERLAGGGLLYEDKLIHLCVFQLPSESGRSTEPGRGRMVRSSRRQRRWIH